MYKTVAPDEHVYEMWSSDLAGKDFRRESLWQSDSLEKSKHSADALNEINWRSRKYFMVRVTTMRNMV